MIENKRINVIVAVAMVAALLLVGVLYALAHSSGVSAAEPEYATKIFGEDIITIDIEADEDEWQEMLDKATAEEFIMADITVNGTGFESVGIRPKGNSSLTQVAQSDSDRYSFRLQFDEYIKDESCFGLDSLVLNNMIGDDTYMKEYISYDLMREAGVDVPYFGFASITVNGEPWGLYLAVEMYNDSYEQRVSGDTSGELYNVKSMDMGQRDDDAGEMAPPDGMTPPDRTTQSDSGSMGDTSDRATTTGETVGAAGTVNTDNGDRSKGFGGMGGPGGSSGGALVYTDDDPDSYGAIFNNVVGKGDEDEYDKVIEALQALSEGRDLEEYFDVDEILRYLAAHTVVVNPDSYSSSMAQNYYIYEYEGQVTVLPWDYNLAWGGFRSSSASSVVNFPIDTPVSGVEMSERPLIEKLFENPEYLEKYHTYLQQLIDNYFANDKFAAKIAELDALIGSYVEDDATKFCTYEEYRKAAETFITLGDLRAESIQGQLGGTIPSTTDGQSADPDALIAADSINLSDLGSSMGGGGGNQQGGDGGGFGDFGGPGGAMPDKEVMEQAMTILQSAGGKVTDVAREQLTALGLTAAQIEMLSNFSNRGNGDGMPGVSDTQSSDGSVQSGTDGTQSGLSEDETGSLILVAVLMLCLVITTVFAARWKRKY